jgi:hypothetical protein
VVCCKRRMDLLTLTTTTLNPKLNCSKRRMDLLDPDSKAHLLKSTLYTDLVNVLGH